ncbi:hypothetical protein BDA99DRAFT_539391 [Phascolomyces articulosus]|uniref:Uncharacterized protein n=1 Tax=Phascolomyces articulosus TaxID=60185 RepID=A0AAD5JW33_9FUNG|nr:hypothetical protein BDA99DRAFT_539391 [Phascolomyces articulosus]
MVIIFTITKYMQQACTRSLNRYPKYARNCTGLAKYRFSEYRLTFEILLTKEKEPKITQSELAKWAKDEFKLEKVPPPVNIWTSLPDTGLTNHWFNEYQFSERVLYIYLLILHYYSLENIMTKEKIGWGSLIVISDGIRLEKPGAAFRKCTLFSI